MSETLRHLDLAIEALRRTLPGHRMLRELEICRENLTRHMMPKMFAEYRE